MAADGNQLHRTKMPQGSSSAQMVNQRLMLPQFSLWGCLSHSVCFAGRGWEGSQGRYPHPASTHGQNNPQIYNLWAVHPPTACRCWGAGMGLVVPSTVQPHMRARIKRRWCGGATMKPQLRWMHFFLSSRHIPLNAEQDDALKIAPCMETGEAAGFTAHSTFAPARTRLSYSVCW